MKDRETFENLTYSSTLTEPGIKSDSKGFGLKEFEAAFDELYKVGIRPPEPIWYMSATEYRWWSALCDKHGFAEKRLNCTKCWGGE